MRAHLLPILYVLMVLAVLMVPWAAATERYVLVPAGLLGVVLFGSPAAVGLHKTPAGDTPALKWGRIGALLLTWAVVLYALGTLCIFIFVTGF